MRYAMFIGRWQPFHQGHRWLIDQKLKKNIPVLICIRDIKPDENNPLTSYEVLTMLSNVFENNTNVHIKIIPDIESVNYGRGVGYEINEYVPPNDIETISATEIRNKIKNNDESWKNMVDQGAINFLEKKFGQDK